MDELSRPQLEYAITFPVRVFLATVLGLLCTTGGHAQESQRDVIQGGGVSESEGTTFAQFLAQAAFQTETEQPRSDSQRSAMLNDASGGNPAVSATGPDNRPDENLAIEGPEILPTPQPTVDGSISEGSSENDPTADDLRLSDVIASVYRSYPDINRARLQLRVASGELLSAYGSFDTKFGAYSLSEPTGFYRTYRNGLGVARQTWWGGYVSAGYRIGRGHFQPWYKERQTDDAGEFKVNYVQSLLRGRAIDPQRVAVFQQSIAQTAVEPAVQQTILEISREAAIIYWDWVAAGQMLEAQKELRDLADVRGKKLNAGVKAGALAEVDLILNNQLLAERTANVFKATQKFRNTGLKLSIFIRDEAGQPMVPAEGWLPSRLPQIQEPPTMDFNSELANALSRRPELQLLALERQHVSLDRRLARNDMLPTFDFVAEASQDMGEPSTKSDDKGEFELVIGFASEVPIQRRKARGKVQSTTAKIAQINQKQFLTQNKIAADLQAAANALELTYQVVVQSEESLQAAVETLRRYRVAFNQGKIDLIYLNLLETKANETELKLIAARRDWFDALVDLQTVMGIDPLDSAMEVAALPPEEMPAVIDLQGLPTEDEKAVLQDWEIHEGGKKADPNE